MLLGLTAGVSLSTFLIETENKMLLSDASQFLFLDQMVLVLCVAEKNSIAREVSKILSRGQNSNDPSRHDKYTRNYHFRTKFSWLPDSADVVMTSVRGHLTELVLPPGMQWGHTDPFELFKCPVNFNVSESMLGVAENLLDLATKADYLMIWTDADREGEFIGGEISGLVRIQDQRLYRAHFSHLEPAHIWYAANNPKRLNQNEVQAVKARIEIDLRSGYAFTRLLTSNLKQPQQQQNAVVSFGNCQFPTMGFVVDRFERIRNFKPEQIYTIAMVIKMGSDEKVKMNWQRGHVLDRLAITAIYQSCINSPSSKIVKLVSLKDSPTSNWAPLPLTTVELQKDCSRLFKFSAKDTLSIAEKLYQQGLISYPRTETDSFANSTNFTELINRQCGSSIWGQYAQSLLQNFRQPRKGKNNDEAHPPIHPVSPPTTPLSGKDAKVYEYITRRFLACLSHDAKGSKRTLVVKWSDEVFTASGLTVLERNYLDIYPYSNWKSTLPIPNTHLNEFDIHQCKISSSKTSPPTGLTETELIALMDVNGIGTDATIAEHIEKVIQRGYIVKSNGPVNVLPQQPNGRPGTGKYLLPTKLGYGLVNGFGKVLNPIQGGLDVSLTKPFLRKQLETQLDSISKGQTNSDEVIRKMVGIFMEVYDITRGNMHVIKREVLST